MEHKFFPISKSIFIKLWLDVKLPNKLSIDLQMLL